MINPLANENFPVYLTSLKIWDHEKLNIKFWKYILRVSKKSTNIAVISEMGWLLLYCDIILQMLMYWQRLEQSVSDLVKSAKSSLNLTNLDGKSWYLKILFISENFEIDPFVSVYIL